MSYFHIPITGRLIDPMGDPVSGAAVTFRAKATSKGLESVAKTTVASFTTDANGYYATEVPSGWYQIEFQPAGEFDSVKLGAATVTGNVGMDLGTLISNSIPPPSQLENISDVSVSGRQNASILSWNASRRQWQTSVVTGSLATTVALAATGANLQSQINVVTGHAGFHWARFPQTVPSGYVIEPGFNALLVGTVTNSGLLNIPSNSFLVIV